jgi:hypothetical protein
MRKKQIRMSAELLTRILTTGHELRRCVVKAGIPEGAILRAVGFNREDNTYWIEVEHPDFPFVKPGGFAPVLDIVIHEPQ